MTSWSEGRIQVSGLHLKGKIEKGLRKKELVKYERREEGRREGRREGGREGGRTKREEKGRREEKNEGGREGEKLE